MANLNVREMAKIAVDKKLCKEYNDASKGVDNFIVYLNDGDEFQIQLFNPTNQVIGAKLKFNDEHKGWFSSDNYIVLRPGERVWLERFLDRSDKFVFNTYEVSNSKQVLEAIKDNGDITIQFYYEDTSHDVIISCPSSDFYYGSGTTFYANTGNIKYGTNSCVCGLNSRLESTTAGDSINEVVNALNDSLGFAPSSTSYSTYASTIDVNAQLGGKTRCSKSTSHSNNRSIETGRVEHGSHSNQDFKYVYYKFQTWPFASKNFKLLPMSRKQYSEGDLRKVYCTNCGKKLSPKFKFCPACGAKVIN